MAGEVNEVYTWGVAWLTRTFTTEVGRKPVEEWIASLDASAKAEVLVVIELLDGSALREPFSKHIDDGILGTSGEGAGRKLSGLLLPLVQSHVWVASRLHQANAEVAPSRTRNREAAAGHLVGTPPSARKNEGETS